MTGRPADPRPGLDADLATLRHFSEEMSLELIERGDEDVHELHGKICDISRRVEAELSRLREERLDAVEKCAGWIERAVAAEAECARLQQALLGTRERTAPDGQPCWCPDWKVDDWRGYSTDDWRDPDLQVALHHECCIAAREALAGPDTPADSQPKDAA